METLKKWICSKRSKFFLLRVDPHNDEGGKFENGSCFPESVLMKQLVNAVELQWLEHLCNHENMFETGVVRANEC